MVVRRSRPNLEPSAAGEPGNSREHESSLTSTRADYNGRSSTTPLLIPGFPPLVMNFILAEDNLAFNVFKTVKKTAELNAKAILVVARSLSARVMKMIDSDRILVVPFDVETDIPECALDAVMELRLPNPKTPS